MTTQPEALRLADALQHLVHHRLGQAQYQAAAELRRQHSRIAELEAALNVALFDFNYIQHQTHIGHICDTASAAIAKLKEVRK